MADVVMGEDRALRERLVTQLVSSGLSVPAAVTRARLLEIYIRKG